MSEYNPIGTAIRKQRKTLGLTLQQLAAKIGGDSGNLSRIERGEQGLTEAMLHKISTALNCTPAFLYSQQEYAQYTQKSPLIASEKFAEYANLTSSSTQELSKPQEFVSWFRSQIPFR